MSFIVNDILIILIDYTSSNQLIKYSLPKLLRNKRNTRNIKSFMIKKKTDVLVSGSDLYKKVARDCQTVINGMGTS